MSAITVTRPASIDEIASEMDRRGHVIEILEARIEELQAECALLTKMQQRAGDTSMLYEIRAAMGWNDKTSLSIMPDGIRSLRKDSLRYHYLKDHCSSFYAMTQEQPAEWSISWEFQQRKPHEAWGSFDKWIDEDIARRAELDAEDVA